MSDTFDDQKRIMLTRQLRSFDIDATSARIYLYLLNKDALSVLELSRALDLPRTSIYDHLDKLANKGLINKMAWGKGNKFAAYQPDILQDYIDNENARVASLQANLDFLQTHTAARVASERRTEVRHYQGPQGMKQMSYNTLRAKHEAVGYSQFGRYKVVGLEFFRKKIRRAAELGIHDRVIVNTLPPDQPTASNGGFGEDITKTQEMRCISADLLSITGDISIYNDIFAVIYWDKGEIVGVEIEDADFARLQKSIFEILWRQATPYTGENEISPK